MINANLIPFLLFLRTGPAVIYLQILIINNISSTPLSAVPFSFWEQPEKIFRMSECEK